MTQLLQLDQDIFLFFNGMHAPFWDIFMRLFSGKWLWVPMYAAILWAVWRSYTWRVALTMTVAAVLVIVVADQTCATLIRPYICRVRPSQPDNPLSALTHVVMGYRGGHYGFPSCHAANSFGLAVFMSLLMCRRRWVVFMLAWATVNCYTRVYLGVHYPGDLLVGAIIGSTAASLLYLLTIPVLSHWAAPHGLRQVPPLRLRRLGTRELYYRSFDIPIAVGLLTVVCIALRAALA